MKKTDIAMIILIATVGVMVSFFVVKAILGETSSEPKKVKVIERIEAGMPEVDKRIFNSNAINPSVEIEIDASSANEATTEAVKSEAGKE